MKTAFRQNRKKNTSKKDVHPIIRLTYTKKNTRVSTGYSYWKQIQKPAIPTVKYAPNKYSKYPLV